MKAKQFLTELKALQSALTAQIQAMTHDWDDSPKAIADRRARVFNPIGGYEYFVRTYFPHYIRNPDKSKLHEYLFEVLPAIAFNEQSQKQAIAAPRAEAKSTIVSKLYPIWRTVIGKLRYALIAMDSIRQAYTILTAIKAELESNIRLKTDFPEVFGVGVKWQEGEIITKNNVKIEVAGSGQRLRGLTHGAYRPDLVILDDIENDKNVLKAEQRDKTQDWIRQTIEPLGVAGEKMDIVYIGTILHYDSVLNRTLNSPEWVSARFKAIIQMPENMALWDEWEALYLAKQLDEAMAFYQMHKKQMDKGAVVSWQARPILTMMTIRANNRKAFDSEYQNDPTAGDDAPFANAINYWSELPDNLIYFGAVDPSLGKAGASRDPSAIVVAGLDRTTGKVYIIEANIKKRLPDRIISDVIAMQDKYNCTKWAVEAVQFQEFLRTEIVRRGAESGVPIPAVPIKPTSDKLLRIESLQPYMTNGVLLLHSSQSTLIDQFRHFPKADHDDGADAVEMVYKLASTYVRQAQITPIHIPTPSMYS
ncbi:phage terminase large subunit [Moraxella bovis]|uniref:phage terminase large subunit n=1 Tax=Moraxella bovis TaxID=476 RepID=UPI002227A4A9|nr:phage terminase large subunit [Moraxella bovis]UZA16609.1 phage terminase large subunit [Moraxella bovis]UZA23881.1 phage terminase large subunit [Moraxella bovis]UZA30134.1 phage terminase large subunit [Moraxella bovis]